MFEKEKREREGEILNPYNISKCAQRLQNLVAFSNT